MLRKWNFTLQFTFDKSWRTVFELTVQSLDQYSQLFQNGITEDMFAKTHGIILLDLSSTQDLSIVQTGTVHLEFGGEYYH